MGNLGKIIAVTILVTILMSMPLNVLAQRKATIGIPSFTVQFQDNIDGQNIVVKIKTPTLDRNIRYNIRIQSYIDEKWGSWREVYSDYTAPAQTLNSAETTIFVPTSIVATQVNIEVQAIMTHKEVVNKTIYPPPLDVPIPVEVTIIDSKSDWSNPQTLTLVDGAKGVPTTIAPTTPKPTQTTTPTPTQDPEANLAQWAEQIGTAFRLNWQTVALGAMAIISAGLVAGMFMLWRKVGNLTSEKQSA